MDKLHVFIVVSAIILAAFFTFYIGIRCARASRRRTAFLGLAAQILSAGVDPEPPPQAQREAGNHAMRVEKGAEAEGPES